MSTDSTAHFEVARTMRRIYSLGLTSTSGGNVSMRNECGIWITASGVDKGELSDRDIALIGTDGCHLGGPHPSSEWPFHVAIYRARPDVRAIVHAHSTALVAYSLVDCELNLGLIPSSRQVCGSLAPVAYLVPGTNELANALAAAFAEGHGCALMQNHGIVIGADSLGIALSRLEVLEATARSLSWSTALGAWGASTEFPSWWLSPEIPDASQLATPTASIDPNALVTRSMLELAKRAHRRGLLQTGRGWIVAKCERERLLIAMNTDFEMITVNDLHSTQLPIDLQAAHGTPDGLLDWLVDWFVQRPNLGALIHAYPPAASAFGLSDRHLLPIPIPESFLALGQVPIVRVANLIAGESRSSAGPDDDPSVMILAHDGVLVSGRSLLEAYDRLEVLEASAESILRAVRLGEPRVLRDGDVDALRPARQANTIREGSYLDRLT